MSFANTFASLSFLFLSLNKCFCLYPVKIRKEKLCLINKMDHAMGNVIYSNWGTVITHIRLRISAV